MATKSTSRAVASGAGARPAANGKTAPQQAGEGVALLGRRAKQRGPRAADAAAAAFPPVILWDDPVGSEPDPEPEG